MDPLDSTSAWGGDSSVPSGLPSATEAAGAPWGSNSASTASGAGPSSPSATAGLTSSTVPDVREPRTYGEPVPALAEPTRQPTAPYLRVRIAGIDRNRKDLLVRFDTSTNLPNYRQTLYRNGQRSYAEFQRFAEQAQLVCPQTIIPALPLPHTSAASDEEDDRLVRIALQRWFSRVCEDPVLQHSDELRSFIESDFGYNPVAPPKPASSSSNVLSAALNKVVRRGPLDDDDELANAKITLERLEPAWSSAATAIGQIGKARRALATASSDVGAKMIALATDENDPLLANVERKMGRGYEQIASMAGGQIASDNVILADSLGYQALNAKAAQDALTQRVQVLEDAQSATKAAINKRRNVERLKASSSINPSKVDDAIADMDDANLAEQTLNARLGAISNNLHNALRLHSRNAHEDVAVSLLEHARMSIIYNRHVLRELEALKPDFAKADEIAARTGAASTAAKAAGNTSPYAASGARSGGSAAAVYAQGQRAGAAGAAAGGARVSPSSTGTPQTPQTPAPATAQSMFLPASSGSRPGTPADPLGGGVAQSMVLPGQQQKRPPPRRLDERKAAKLLAGGF